MTELEAGRELDAEVAIKVMGWKWLLSTDGVRQLFPPGTDPLGWNWMNDVSMATDYERVPYYSTDIAAAWQVVEKLRLAVVPLDDEWFAGTFDGIPHVDEDYGGGYIDCGASGVYALTAPLAICRAALSRASR